MFVFAGWYSIVQPNLPSDAVRRIVVCERYVLVGTTIGVGVYDTGSGKWNKKVLDAEVKDLILVENEIWAATLSGIYKGSKDTLSFSRLSSLPASSVEVVGDKIAVGTYGAGIMVFDITGNLVGSLASADISNVTDLELYGSSLMVANASGAVISIPADLTSPSGSCVFSGHGDIKRMRLISGSFYVATSEGLFKDGSVVGVTSGKSVEGFDFMSGELWFAAFGEGVYREGEKLSTSTTQFYDLAVVSEQVWVASDSGILVYEKEVEELISLLKVYPNPGTPPFTVCYKLTKKSTVTINIFSIFGKKIKCLLSAAPKGAGVHSEDLWDGLDQAGTPVGFGVFLVVVEAESGDLRDSKEFKLVVNR